MEGGSCCMETPSEGSLGEVPISCNASHALVASYGHYVLIYSLSIQFRRRLTSDKHSKNVDTASKLSGSCVGGCEKLDVLFVIRFACVQILRPVSRFIEFLPRLLVPLIYTLDSTFYNYLHQTCFHVIFSSETVHSGNL